LKPSQPPAPLHLVISPYPDQYEEHTQTSAGIDMFVRPIRPEDAPLLVELFESLSPQSVYRRFFSPMKRLPHSMLALRKKLGFKINKVIYIGPPLRKTLFFLEV
jgi:acetyltransferase